MPLTIEQPQHLNGLIRAERTKQGTCAIIWTFRSRSVLVSERPEAGPKRALMEFFKRTPRDAERTILRLEADAEAILVAERQQAEFAFVIESDPYVGA